MLNQTTDKLQTFGSLQISFEAQNMSINETEATETDNLK
jgi:hypothetical protein